MKKVALVTAAEALDVDEDMPPLLRALEALGIPAEPVVWDDPRADWGSYAIAVVRSTWDYIRRYAEFLAWADRAAGLTQLSNPAPILRWNTDKRYLRELAGKGNAVVPTFWFEPGDPVRIPCDGDCVVKPAISAGSQNTARYSSARKDEAVEHVRSLQGAGKTVMVQPYLDRMDEYGETGLVFLGGVYSHAIRKGPILKGAIEVVGGLFAKEDIRRREPSAAERRVAEQALEAVPGGAGELLYARVDVAPGPDGEPVVLEMELAEPSLFFNYSDGAEHVMARAIAKRISP